ncbi:hypothetical protein FCL38_15160 [Pseudoduganella umbonata]|nr:hypothetical protein FCL38_15160 [Pseudoduganella umbonata]
MGISRKMVEQHIALAMAACRRCKAGLDAPGSVPARDAVRRRRAIVASLALVLPGGVAGALWWRPVATSVHATARGERIDTMLADGSRLQLAPDSRAAVGIYRNRREIELARGQARFEISRDAGRPLTVLAGALRITVVGTRFSVHHAAGPHGGVRVAVEEGRVRVARGGWFADSGSVELVAGQAVAGDANGTLGTVGAVLAADLSPWHARRMSFDNATLGRVLAAFERYGDSGLRVRDPAVAALRLTGTFDLLRPDRFAQLLPHALPVRLSSAGGLTEIRAR